MKLFKLLSLIAIVLASFFLSFTSSFANLDPQAPENSKIPVIIDTDMAIDDWLAILYLANHPNVEIKAITVTGAGEAHCEPGVKYAADLLALADYSPVPITCGRERPYAGGHDFPKKWREQVDALLNIDIPAANWPQTSLNATELLTKTINEYPEEVIIVALGPLTNLADLFKAHPETVEKINMTYVMGGAVNVAGNIKESEPSIDNEVAEWNIFADPVAAKEVLHSGAQLTFIPLDATNKVPLTSEFYSKLKQNNFSKSTNFVVKALGKNGEFTHPEGWYFWDPLAAAIAVDESLASIEIIPLDISIEDDKYSGQMIVSPDGVSVNVAVDANSEFKQLFIDILNRKSS